jgi:hypothetical protein
MYMDEITVISVRTSGEDYSMTLYHTLTATEYLRACVSLAKAQGYILSNVAEALDVLSCEVHEELAVLQEN